MVEAIGKIDDGVDSGSTCGAAIGEEACSCEAPRLIAVFSEVVSASGVSATRGMPAWNVDVDVEEASPRCNNASEFVLSLKQSDNSR